MAETHVKVFEQVQFHAPVDFKAAVTGITSSGSLKFFYPPDYQTVGNGVADDTVPLQNCLNAAGAVGGAVIVPPLPFKVKSLTVPPGIAIIGFGEQDSVPDGVNPTGSQMIGTTGFDMLSLPTTASAFNGFTRIEGINFRGGQNQMVSTDSCAFIKVRDCTFSNPAIAGFNVTAGSMESFVFEECDAIGGQYFFKHANVISGANVLDKGKFIGVNCHGQTVNAYKIEALTSTDVEWVGGALVNVGQHGFYADSGARQWKFIGLNTEGNGQTGKSARTTGSVNSGSATLTVASASGFTNGDPIVVAGAGNAVGRGSLDLFTTISSISGTTITLATNAVTTVTSVAVTNASYDDFFFGLGNVGNAADCTFVGGAIGGEASGHLRYGVNMKAATDFVFINTTVQAAIPLAYNPNNSVQLVAPDGTARTGEIRTPGGFCNPSKDPIKLGNGTSFGSVMFSGTGAPSSSLGANGDFYFRQDTPGTTNQRLYVKSGGSWTGIL